VSWRTLYWYKDLSPAEQRGVVWDRWRRGLPPHAPPHFAQGHSYYLISAVCYEHAHYLADRTRRRRVMELLSQNLQSETTAVLAWVVLPNHCHVLVHSPDVRGIGSRLRLVHGPTAREWNLADSAPGRKVWYRYTDRAIRSEAHYCATLNYIHYNPVKHGWAQSPYDWSESSVHWYLDQHGRVWLRDLWTGYPLHDCGKGWDDA
jgi:putative transposase